MKQNHMRRRAFARFTDITELPKAARPPGKLSAALRAREGQGKAWIGSGGIAKPVGKGLEKGLAGVWVSGFPRSLLSSVFEPKATN
jgi:hypothetical protein